MKKKKTDIDPIEVRVDLWDNVHMQFPGGEDPDQLRYTWTLEKDVPVKEDLQAASLPEDILEAEKKPTQIYNLAHRKYPEVIKAAVRKYPKLIENLDPRYGLTNELLVELMKENGTWLRLVNVKYKTLDVCLAAIRQTAIKILEI